MADRAKKIQALEGKGRRALHEHAAACAEEARARYGQVDYETLLRILEDRRVVRYPTRLEFDADALEPGEFAHAAAVGDHPRDGFVLNVNPYFRDRPDDLRLLIAYHLVTINYGDVATNHDAEIFAATLLGLDQEAYYQRVCELADELDAADSKG